MNPTSNPIVPDYTGCQWIGADQDPALHWPIKYCGCATLKGLNYCAEHYAGMYQKGTALARRKKDQRRAEQIRMLESLFNDAVAELELEGFDVYGNSRQLDEDLA